MSEIGDWRYGLVLVDIEDGEEQCELMELYLDEKGTPIGFSQPHLGSLVALRMAISDVEKYGVERIFYETGKFIWNHMTLDWEWERSKSDGSS